MPQIKFWTVKGKEGKMYASMNIHTPNHPEASGGFVGVGDTNKEAYIACFNQYFCSIVPF